MILYNYYPVYIDASVCQGGVSIGKTVIPEGEKILMEDTATYIKSPREIRQCKVYLTQARIAAHNRPASIFKNITSLLSNSDDVCFEILLKNISSMRDAQYGSKRVVVLKTDSGTEYALYFNLPGQKWKQNITDTVLKSEPDIIIKIVGDYVRFKRR